jgi:hypothetical protein
MTLTEVLITSTVLVVLLGMVFGSLSLIENVSSNVGAQYQEFDQALPALAPFHSLLAAQVEPGPNTVSGAPTPGFSSIGNFSVTFYTNIGTAYGNVVSCPSGGQCAGTTAGPAKIQAVEVNNRGQLVTDVPSMTCTTASPCSLQVRMYLPMVVAGVSTCPGVSTDPNAICQYPANYRLLANVLGVVNSPSDVNTNPSDPNFGGPNNPIFTYTIFDPTLNKSFTPTSVEVANQSITTLPAVYGAGATASLVAANCAAGSVTVPVAISCPADAIQSVGVDVQIAKPGSNSNTTVNNSTVVYRYAQTNPNSSVSPYQYSATVG